MAGRLQLEVFETEKGASDALLLEQVQIEEIRLEAFEQGYKAGWDDAVAANAQEQEKIGADLARHLHALSFTYHEARANVLRSVGPLLSDIAAKLLPVVAAESLAPMIVERMMPLVEARAEVPVTILVNPKMHAAVAAVLDAQEALPVALEDEPTLGEGQAVLRFGAAEDRIDLDGVVEAIRAALAEYFTQAEQERIDG
jgi:flagellar biosynthesis/type III secretory pathway protein FliH